MPKATKNQKASAKFAAEVAKRTAGKELAVTMKDAEYMELTKLMCWEAAALCFLKGESIEAPAFKKAGAIIGDVPLSYIDFIDPAKDPVVPDAKAMKKVNEGCFLAFFFVDNGKMVLMHAMITIGDGCAAGNKNGCIGIGSPVGWETLNLVGDNTDPKGKKKAIKWEGGGFKNPEGRPIQVHYRPLGA